MSILLALLFPIAIQYERRGWWRIVLPITLLTFVIDLVANWTELSLALWEWPRPGEYTFSSRLNRLVHNIDWRGRVARHIAKVLNEIDPLHSHINLQ